MNKDKLFERIMKETEKFFNKELFTEDEDENEKKDLDTNEQSDSSNTEESSADMSNMSDMPDFGDMKDENKEESDEQGEEENDTNEKDGNESEEGEEKDTNENDEEKIEPIEQTEEGDENEEGDEEDEKDVTSFDEPKHTMPLTSVGKARIRRWLLTNEKLTKESFDGLVSQMKVDENEGYRYLFLLASKLFKDREMAKNSETTEK